MLNFRDNFFFTKFTVLFFILTIFGYWGIDLNSEELYIAFSFFLLVILGVVVSRKSVLLLFVKSVNLKYFRILSDLLVVVGALKLRVSELEALAKALTSLNSLIKKLFNFAFSYLRADVKLTSNALSARTALALNVVLPLGIAAASNNFARLKKFHSFGLGSKFFSIKF